MIEKDLGFFYFKKASFVLGGIMIKSRHILFLWVSLCLTTTLQADWSVTKLVTIDHYGSPSENDGFHPEAFTFEKTLNEKSYLSIGVIENSEERIGLFAGYSTIYRQYGRLSLTRHIYVSSNYKKLPFIVPIPMLGVQYQINKNISVRLEGVPVPNTDPYILYTTSINFKL